MPGAKRSRLTLQDVAAELGVSAKTVSNAYRHPDQLSAQLRVEVLAAAARLGYAGPDPLAAGLRRGRVGSIGIAYANQLSYAFEDPVTVELLAGLTSITESSGVGLLLLSGSGADERRSSALSAAVIDALIVNSLATDDPLLAAATVRRLPLAVIDQPEPAQLAELGAPDGPWIGIDDEAGAAAVAEHVLALGHRRLAVVSFGLHRRPVRGLVDEREQATSTYTVTRRRLAGYRKAAVQAGLAWARVPVYQGADSTIAEGEAGGAAVLATNPRPTAVLCLSDRLAEGVLRAAAAFGLRVPEDLSICGFDDARPAESLRLTTLSQPNRRKGELAAAAVLRLLDGSVVDPRQTLPTKLIVRGTTGPSPPLKD
jgi:DNA-binding LacI/PurR family transcriptional regulator